jgi:uncharacterized coiled-coil DUF342 family protein
LKAQIDEMKKQKEASDVLAEELREKNSELAKATAELQTKLEEQDKEIKNLTAKLVSNFFVCLSVSFEVW